MTWSRRRTGCKAGTVTCNGIPVRHFANKAVAERYATDAEYRASLIVTKYADR